jgi:glutaminase
MTPEGKVYHAGDWRQEFTMQSISKTISLIFALQTVGYDEVFHKVGVEPTGDAFNSIVRLETKTLHPLNPMINAGAIATASCCMGLADPFKDFLALTRRLCGRESIQMDEAVYESEDRTGMRNRSMAYLMQSDNILGCSAEEAVDLYFRMCSVSVTAEDLAHYGLVLCNSGVDPFTGERLVEGWIVRIVKTLMVTCGMYDGSGEFAMKVGMPAKSGVGGGILASVEEQMGIGAFGPALDAKGNSVGAYRLLEYLSNRLRLHYFAGKD